MKIVRTENISNQKDEVAPDWADNKHYHRITISLTYDYKDPKRERFLHIDKELWFITGHGDEQVDEICVIGRDNVIFKTHDLEKITPELEVEMINVLYKNYLLYEDKKRKEIDELNEYIKESENDRKLLNVYLREDKLKRILK
jgi:hypothetical protein